MNLNHYGARVIWTCLCLLACHHAWAQEPTARTTHSPVYGSGSYRGRQLGFIPRHARLEEPRNVSQASPQQVQVANGLRMSDSQLANYESTAAGEVLPAPTPATTVDESSMFVEDEGCSPMNFGEPMCPEPRLFGRADYLLYWTKGMHIPALATTSRASATQDEAGVLGVRTTSILYGDSDILDQARSGGQYQFGWWLDDCHLNAIEFTYLDLNNDDDTFAASNTTNAILARPFIQVPGPTEDAQIIAFPGAARGSLRIDSDTDFQTAEVALRHQVVGGIWDVVNCSIGYRYAELNDEIGFSQSTTALSGVLANSTIALNEQFSTHNQFHGGQLAFRATPHASRPWSLELISKIAIGNTKSDTKIRATTVSTTAAGASTTTSAGLLALPTNLGDYSVSKFGAITEVGASLRRHFGDRWSASVGYNILFWTDVLRAGDQIDRTVNTSQIPPGTLAGTRRPVYPQQDDGFWAQGLRFGLECNY